MTIAADTRPQDPAASLRADGSMVVRSRLSPSRASDFLTCPLLFRYRTIDRRPEPASPAMVRGTVVHAVLEDLFERPAAERTVEAARTMLPDAWDRCRAEDPRLDELFPDRDAPEHATWLASAADLLTTYFRLEDPTRLEPSAREERVEHRLGDTVTLGGIVDRVDVAPDGRIRIVDYKTGKAPSERFEDKALFQMKFYALVVWRTRGVMPSLLQLMYLADGQILRHEPTEAELEATERKVGAIWAAVAQAVERGEFVARRGSLCSFCAHQDVCPEFGGTPPPLPPMSIA